MGRSLTSNHIFNAEKLTKAQFKKKFTDMMKAMGYTSAKADDGEISYALAFSGDRSWVTVLTEESTDTRKEASELAKNLGLQVLSAELVDSDFAELTLYEKSGAAVDTMFLGEPYFEEYPEPSPLKWQTLLNIDWAKVEEIQSKDHTFADDALCEFGEVIGCENMLLEFDGADDDAVRLYFKKAGEKKLTLNAAFKQVFGPELEKQGFKLANGTKKPIYYRVVSDELIYVISISDKTKRYPVMKDEKAFEIEGDVLCTYCNYLGELFPDIDFMSNSKIYGILASRNKDEEYDLSYIHKINDLVYKKDNKDDLINVMQRAYRITQNHLISEIFKVSDMNSFIRYYRIFYGGFLNIKSAFNEFGVFESGLKESGDSSLVLIKANDHDDGMWNVLEECECLSKTMKRNRTGFDPIRYQKEFDEWDTYTKEVNELRDKIFNTSELYNKAIELADRIKAENIEVLRSYGIEI